MILEDNHAHEKNLSDAFYETLKDVYFAEKQSVKACKKSAKAAQSTELKKAFADHGEESQGHVDRLVQVFEILGKPVRGKTCDAMVGITSEMEEDLEDFGGTTASDAVLIGCGQACRMRPSCSTRRSRRSTRPTLFSPKSLNRV